MVGLSVVLEAQRSRQNNTDTQVINKATMSSSSMAVYNTKRPSKPQTFLDRCFLCNEKLVPGKDIYMYKGDQAFCSVECRSNQIFSDEAEETRKEKCSMAASKPNSSSSSAKRSSTAAASSGHQKGARSAGGIAY